MIQISMLLAGSVIGYFAWGFSLQQTALALILFGLYFTVEKRSSLWWFALGYYLAGSRGLLIGTATYYDDKLLYGLLVWSAAALINATAWAVVWHRNLGYRYLLFPLLLVVLIFPPVGIISWINPLITVGLFLPGSGFWGFVWGIVALYLWRGLYGYHKYMAWILAISMGFAMMMVELSYSQGGVTDRFDSLHSRYDYGAGEQNQSSRTQRQMAYLKRANASTHHEVILPENALGVMRQSNMIIWGWLKEGKTVLSGAHIKDIQHPKQYDNVLLSITDEGYQVLYAQRMPVPVSMWKPWAQEGAKAHWRSPAVIQYDNLRMGVLICYEQILSWTYLTIFLEEPDMLLGISNLWWARDTSIRRIEEQNLQLWSRLFDVPMLFVYNQ